MIVGSTLALAGCSTAVAVDGLVKEREGAAQVKSCHKIGDAITDAEDYGTSVDDLDYSATLDEVWKCGVKRLDGTSRFVDVCYILINANSEFTSIVRRVDCESVGEGCPLRARRGDLLGRILDPTWVYEKTLANANGTSSGPAYKTVRVEVSYQETKGHKEHCGYLNVWVPIGDDVGDPSQHPTALAAEMIETQWTDDPHYSFSYLLVDD